MVELPNQRGLLRVAGVVGGLVSCTVAVVTRRVDGSTVTNSQTFTTRGRRGATAAEHRARVAEQADTVDHAIGPVVLVVIEGLAAAATTDDRVLYRATLARLRARAVPVAVAGPGTRAPGGDRAERARYLAHLGALGLGWQVPILERPRVALAGICWPANLDAPITLTRGSSVTADQHQSTAPGVSVLPTAGDHGPIGSLTSGNVAGDLGETAGRESGVTGRHPRRPPAAGLPRLAEADRPDPDELDQVRTQVHSARRLRGRSHPDRPVCP